MDENIIDYNEIVIKINICERLLTIRPKKLYVSTQQVWTATNDIRNGLAMKVKSKKDLEIFWEEVSCFWYKDKWLKEDIIAALRDYRKLSGIQLTSYYVESIYNDIINGYVKSPRSSVTWSLYSRAIELAPELSGISSRVLIRYLFDDLYYLSPDIFIDLRNQKWDINMFNNVLTVYKLCGNILKIRN